MKKAHFSNDELNQLERYFISLGRYLKLHELDEHEIKLRLFDIIRIFLYDKYLSQYRSGSEIPFSDKIDAYQHIFGIVQRSKIIYKTSNPKIGLTTQIENATKLVESTNKYLSELDDRTVRYNIDELVIWEQILEIFKFFKLYCEERSDSYV